MAAGGFESLDDPVDVLTVFEEGDLKPLRFRWQGRVIRVRKVSGTWTRREGQALLRYYAVEGSPEGTYELCFDPRGPRWALTRAWTPEPGAAPAAEGRERPAARRPPPPARADGAPGGRGNGGPRRPRDGGRAPGA